MAMISRGAENIGNGVTAEGVGTKEDSAVVDCGIGGRQTASITRNHGDSRSMTIHDMVHSEGFRFHDAAKNGRHEELEAMRRSANAHAQYLRRKKARIDYDGQLCSQSETPVRVDTAPYDGDKISDPVKAVPDAQTPDAKQYSPHAAGADQSRARLWLDDVDTEYDRGGVSVNGRGFLLCDNLGSGGSGDVFLVQALPIESTGPMPARSSRGSGGSEIRAGSMYALKIAFGRSREEFDMFSKEVEILSKCRGLGFIIQLWDYEIIPNSLGIFMIMEVATGGDLSQYLLKSGDALTIFVEEADTQRQSRQMRTQGDAVCIDMQPAASGPDALDETKSSAGPDTVAKRIPEEKFNERCRNARTFFEQMCMGVDNLHRQNIIHTDLKPANFLVFDHNIVSVPTGDAAKTHATLGDITSNDTIEAMDRLAVNSYSGLIGPIVKVADLGLADMVQSDKSHVTRKTLVGTFQFMSPEAIYRMNEKVPGANSEDQMKALLGIGSNQSSKRQHRFDDRNVSNSLDALEMTKIRYTSDIWSLGIILYWLIYKRTPYAHLRALGHSRLCLVMVDESVAIQFPAGIHLTQEFYRLVVVCGGCLQRDPDVRWNMSRVLQELARDLEADPYDLLDPSKLLVEPPGVRGTLKILDMEADLENAFGEFVCGKRRSGSEILSWSDIISSADSSDEEARPFLAQSFARTSTATVRNSAKSRNCCGVDKKGCKRHLPWLIPLVFLLVLGIIGGVISSVMIDIGQVNVDHDEINGTPETDISAARESEAGAIVTVPNDAPSLLTKAKRYASIVIPSATVVSVASFCAAIRFDLISEPHPEFHQGIAAIPARIYRATLSHLCSPTQDEKLKVKDEFSRLSDKDRNNPDIVSAVCKTNPLAVEYASEEIRGSGSFMRELLKTSGDVRVYKYLPRSLSNDKNFFVNSICDINPLAIQFADESLRRSEVFLFSLLDKCFAKLSNNKEFFRTVCESDPLAVRFADEEVRGDRSFMLELLKSTKEWGVFNFLANPLKSDKEFFEEACVVDPRVIIFASEEVRAGSSLGSVPELQKDSGNGGRHQKQKEATMSESSSPDRQSHTGVGTANTKQSRASKNRGRNKKQSRQGLPAEATTFVRVEDQETGHTSSQQRVRQGGA